MSLCVMLVAFSINQVRDMTAFLIRCCIIGHIKITIHSLYWDIIPYCDNNTASPLFFLLFLYKAPRCTYGHC